MFIEALRIRP
ncbi:uncharacterized protein FFMR_04104 [Fusarium fujikuroi]|nr:uncharacterized protein FFM5_11122 [Fusarium fujikuroi]SCO36486.1 uncharacterized protein FFMR_04104 [Fusarium fujikuroi]SCO37163.1 uncharacterized protein FFNC_05485 [Fusarium fujikuroi]SCO37506.1 uncharacterized protein FFNC_05691 [Fusarium fujikuroi]SCV60633.1 uncharacterized protein FFFS_15202 [Fusarium fujikuroi]